MPVAGLRVRDALSSIAGAGACALLMSTPAMAASPITAIQLVSADASGVPGNSSSYGPSFSPDGNSIVFDSLSVNLGPVDTGFGSDIYLKNLKTGAVTRLSVGRNGAEANDSSWTPKFTPDGKSVYFSTLATNIFPKDKNKATDIVLVNIKTLAVKPITVGKLGQANGFSSSPIVSADGAKIAFTSYAENLVSTDKNKQADIFVKSLSTGAIELVSLNNAKAQGNQGSYAPVFSPDGNLIAFETTATNFVKNPTQQNMILVRNLKTGKVIGASVTATGKAPNSTSLAAVFSPSGTEVAFESRATNLVANDTNNVTDIFMKTLATGKIRRVSVNAQKAQGDFDSGQVVFSPDGKRIAFATASTNFVTGDTNNASDIFLVELATGKIKRISVALDGSQANGSSTAPAFSPDGKRIAFQSFATNLVGGGAGDQIYVVTLAP